MDELTRRAPSGSVVEIVSVDDIKWDVSTDALVAGGERTGLITVLTADEDSNARVTVLEKVPEHGSNTSLSTGIVPATGTRLQREVGVEETSADMVRGILRESDCEASEEHAQYLYKESASLTHQLVDDWDITFHVVGDFKYPKHSEHRMRTPEGRGGENLAAELVERTESVPNTELLANVPVR